MASKLKVFEIKSAVGGLNVYARPTQSKDDQSPDLLNVKFVGISGVTGREGYIKLTSSAVNGTEKIQGLFQYINSSGVYEKLYASGGNLYRESSGSSTLIATACFSSSARRVKAAQVGDRLYFADGVTALCYYDGAAISTTGVSGAPVPSELISYNDRLYCNSVANKDRVFYGNPLTSTGASTNTGDFTVGANSGFFLYGQGKEVVAFSKLGTSSSTAPLYVFLKDSIQRATPSVVSSTTVHTNVTISNSIGCQAPGSVDTVENDIFFLDSTVYSVGEVQNFASLRTRNISAPVENLFKGMTQSALQNADGCYYEKENMYILGIAVSGSTNDHAVVYHAPYKAWTYWDNMSINCMMDTVDSSGIKHCYFGSQSSSYVYELFQGLNDDGAAYTKRYRTKEFSINDFHTAKLFQDWNIQFGGVYGTTTVRMYVEDVVSNEVQFSSGNYSITADGIGTMAIGDFAIGTEGNFTEASSTAATISNDWRWHQLGGLEGTTFSLEIENANIDENFEFQQAAVGFIPLPYYKRSADREV